MRQKLSVQIAGAYCNAQIKCPPFINLFTIYKLDISPKAAGLIDLLDGQLNIFNSRIIRDCKLILTPFSEITDDDIVEVAKLASYHPDFKEDWDNIIADFRVDYIIRHPDRIEVKHTCICFEGSFNLRHDGSMYFTGEDEGVSAQPTVYLPHYAIDYMRQKNYDCGYGHIPSLIDADIAINSNTLKS